jgi:exodeoxyribonuclease I
MSTNFQATMLWHDYETWGATPAVDRVSQFAAVRTDLDLNIIEDPVVMYCQPPRDRLPHPKAVQITGITPQHALEHGLNEADFAQRIFEQMSRGQTVTVGYNNIKFDDEVTRHLFYRNFLPIYDREWKQGNTRWDLINVMRLCYALRPEGINWPYHEEGVPSFKLEDLAKANELDHQNAHDALSDVYATIGLAQLLKRKKSQLYEYAFSLRDKQRVMREIDISARKPLLYISPYISSRLACMTMIVPIMIHPNNKNMVIALDLRYSPEALLNADADTLISAMTESYETRHALMPLIHVAINQSPMIANVQALNDDVSARASLDKQQCWEHYQRIQHIDLSGLIDTLITVLCATSKTDDPTRSADERLYSGGFFNHIDTCEFPRVRAAQQQEWARGMARFSDVRLNELLDHYHATHFFSTLDPSKQQDWLAYTRQNIIAPKQSRLLSKERYIEEVKQLTPSLGLGVADALHDWLRILLRDDVGA